MRQHDLKLGLMLLILLPCTLQPQVTKARFVQDALIMGGVHFQSWSSENDEEVSELMIPMVFVLPLGKRLSFNVASGQAFASLNTAGSDLSGLADTRVRATYLMMNEALMLHGGLNLPTGKSRLGADQALVASALSVNALDFRLPLLGQGFSYSLGAVYAYETGGGAVLGSGFSVVIKDGFEPFEERDLAYKPGNEMTLTLGADKDLEIGGREVKLTGDVTYTRYEADEADGTVIFKSGDKLLVQLRSIFKAGPFDIVAYARNRSKGKNERGIAALQPEDQNSNGNQLEIGGAGYYSLNNKKVIKGLLDLKFYSRNERESGGAFVIGIGGGLQFQLFRRLTLDGQYKLLRGTLSSRNATTRITGYEIGLAVRYRL